MKKSLFLLLIFIPVIIFASKITFEYSFDMPQVENQMGYQTLTIDNSMQTGEVGEPQLPCFGSKLLIPAGEIAKEIKIVKSGLTEINREINLFPTQPPHPFSETNIEFVQPDLQIYNSNEKYPYNEDYHLNTEFLSGYAIAFSTFTPIEYYPAEKKAYYYKNIEVTVTTESSTKALQATRFLKNDEYIVNFVSRNIDNSQLIHSYNVTSTRDGDTDYVIITEEAKVANWTIYADLYRDLGYVVEIETMENIINDYFGEDTQAKVRNFLIEKYENNPLKFVLLAGDVDVIPHRGMYVNMGGGEYTDDDIPADMYYSCLDGTWNDNINEWWGEESEADLAPEFAIGRICYNNDQEITNFINKVDSYLNSPVVDEAKSALFIGEYLWEGPTWGGDYMDEMIGGSDTHGHTTIGVPETWDIETLYERNGNWNAYDLFAQLNVGPNLINHLGHSATYYTLKISNHDVTDVNITNNGENHNHSILFTQGCYGGAFDNRDTNGSYGDDCITEKFLSISNGMVSMISNSRYGWGQQGSTDGASQFFHREYIDAMFGEDIFDLGAALSDAKIDAIPFIMGNAVMYWCTYQTNLNGDPALPVWTDEPQEIVTSYPSELLVGANQLIVTTDIPNANVYIFDQEGRIASGNTGETGSNTIFLDHILTNVEDLQITIVKHNFLAHHGVITVIPGDGPYVVVDGAVYTETEDYIDGSIQPLDIVDISISLNNIGSEITDGDVEATLSCDSEYINIINNNVITSVLDSEETITLENAFQIEILPGLEDQTMIIFDVTLSSGMTFWHSAINLNVNNSQINFVSYTIDVASGDDDVLNPGETADVYFEFENSGAGISYLLQTVAISFDGYLSIYGNSVIDQIDPNSNATTSVPFTLEVSADCPQDYLGNLMIVSGDACGAGIEENISISVGAVSHNFEIGIGDWEHSSLTTGFSDQWHLSDNRNHTQDGEYSMKLGGNGDSDYSNSVHGGLVSPPFVLTSNSYVTFYHWMDAETNSSTQAWDGGNVEISTDGENFEIVTPVGGYPYTIYPNAASPFDPGTPVFSGLHDWEQVQIDLSDYSGTVQLKFVFGSDAAVTAEGWYIDDILIESYTDSNPSEIIPLSAFVGQNYPNPFNPVTTISFTTVDSSKPTEISIFNIKGQKVKTLLNEKLAPGEHKVTWEGKDSQNNKVSSGIYFYKMKSGDFSKINKMILMK
ncbi:MAG: T9SS type A sorting domain-containing protein [Candidatus Cloacimonetes bacterium]|nr:T9SS type A sorting domain-containing protein [Candidatus Cloacimonadota bacterium]